jgi:guanyl-specific ribonuclease Sa
MSRAMTRNAIFILLIALLVLPLYALAPGGGSVSDAREHAGKVRNIEDAKLTQEQHEAIAHTLQRIAAGEKDPHRNDGAIFRNIEKLLDKKPYGYYTEYVVRQNQNDRRSPGAQRLVLGREGEIYYTPDHYQTFIRIQ